MHNWTVEQTCDWLSTSVELPQYVPIFIKYRVTGAHLPRLVTNSINILSKYTRNWFILCGGETNISAQIYADFLVSYG